MLISNEMKKKIGLAILLLIIIAGVFYFLKQTPRSVAQNASNTYYVATNGNNITGNGSSNNPWQTIKYGISKMKGGDTLVIGDGIYTGNDNIINNNQKPPSGSASSYTTIKSENIGKTIIDGEGARQPVSLGDVSYIIFDGLIFRNSSGTVFSLTGGKGGSTFSHHIKIMRCGFADAADNGQAASGDIVFFRYVNYSLIEDSYAWGNGRYRFYILDSSHLILRRCIDRPDRGVDVGYSNQGSFRLYGTSNSLLQNCISIDSNPTHRLTPSGDNLIPATPKIFWIGANSSTGFQGENNIIEGLIALNTGKDLAGFVGNYEVQNNLVKNSVFWDSDNAIWTRCENQADKVYVSHCTFGQIDDPSGYHDHAAEADVYGLMDVKNSLIYGSGDSGLRNVISDYNALYSNKINYQGCSAGSHDICSENSNAIDPIDGNPGNGIPALKYLPKIESGSDLKGRASDGGDIGANIMYKIGKDGTIYGEQGYDELTSESLWPWPYEGLIKSKMNEYNSGGVLGNRGFAGDGNGLYGGSITLTSYIWEYLGNPMPLEIYGSTSDTTAPVRSSGSPAGTLASGTISATLSLVTNEFAICKYSTIANTSYVSMANTFISTGGIAHSQLLQGLTNGGAYNYYIKCKDNSNNSNIDDYLISFSIATPTAGTYYISPNGNNNNAGTISSPWKTFAKVFSSMTAGNELILLDGTYSLAAGTGYINWNDGSCSTCGQPPSGTSLNNMTYIHAQNPGKVTIDGGTRNALFLGRSFRKDSYIKIEGIYFEQGGIFYNTSYNTVKNSSFHSANQGGGAVFGIGVSEGNWGNTNNLIEDVWIWGKERIIASNYRSDNNVWRRILIRGDGCNSSSCTGSGNPNVGITVYNSSNISLQNVMVINRILGGGSPYGDFATAQHAPASYIDQGIGEYQGPNEWLGTISLNGPDSGYSFEADTANPNTVRMQNVIAWNNLGANINIGGTDYNVIVENGTAGISGNGVDNVRIYSSGNPVTISSVKNIIAYNAGRNNFTMDYAPSYVNTYSAIQGPYHFSNNICSLGCKTSNPLSDGLIPSLKYLIRIESGSTLKGAGYNGTDIGANIIYKYGLEGSHYGETNYNTLTSNNLWPWPNEDRIKKEMCTDAGETRGFCSKSSLTRYIWEYLGNPCPPEICGYGSTPATPNITLTLAADKNEVQPDDTITYTLTYQNTSSTEAKNIILTDPIPQGTAYVAGSATNSGVYDAANSRITWTIPTLPGNASGVVSFKVTVE